MERTPRERCEVGPRRGHRPVAWSVAAMLASLLAPARGLAQSTGELADGPDRSRLGVEVGLYTGSNSSFLVSETHTAIIPSLQANVVVTPPEDDVSISLDVAFRAVGSVFRVGSTERTDLRAGNVLVGGRVGFRPIDALRVRAGLGVVGPLMNVYEDAFGRADFALTSVPFSALPNGGWDPWLVLRGTVPVVLRVDAEYRDALFFAGAEAGLGLGVPVLSGYEGVAAMAQLGVWGGVRPVEGLAAGVRLQTVMVDEGARGGSDPSSIGFASVAPFVRGEFGAAFAEMRLFASLADNALYDAIGEKSWGLYLQFGSDFDAP